MIRTCKTFTNLLSIVVLNDEGSHLSIFGIEGRYANFGDSYITIDFPLKEHFSNP